MGQLFGVGSASKYVYLKSWPGKNQCLEKLLLCWIKRGERNKPGSVVEGHPSQRPTHRHRADHPQAPAYLALLRPRGCQPRPGRPDRRWALTPPFHPCLCASMKCTKCTSAVWFLWPDLGITPSRFITERPVLWSPDFPQGALECTLRPSTSLPV